MDRSRCARRGPQASNGPRDPFGRVIDAGASHQHVRARACHRPRRLGVDASIHFQIAPCAMLLDHRAQSLNFAERAGDELLAPKPGLTVMHSTRSTSPKISCKTANGVAGLMATPACLPSSLICWIVRLRWG